MSKDPQYFLDKAKYFRKIAGKDYRDISSSRLQIPEEYEYVQVNPTVILAPSVPSAPSVPISGLQYKRYYDPVSRHYYRTDDILENSTPQAITDLKFSGTWFPENRQGFQVITDPQTGITYRVNKIYDANGNFYHECREVQQCLQQDFGTNSFRYVYL